ncbi:transposase [Petrotoga olearia]|nr:transposase [Petrotoga olearia DSM 13574]RMA76463.1 transposase [Petrotoga olearia]
MKSYPPELKANVVKEHVEKGVSCSQLSKTYNIPTRNIYKWVKKFRD